ncbi:MAG: glycosyltransferase family 2 protein [Planctomycetes bacterium]|nr:glycosyltransferase family 2 protein [Planctomycetota bacterium]
MINGKRVVVVMPAYNAAKTLEKTYREIPFDVVDEVVLVDDASRDETVYRAGQLGVRHIILHPRNRGYGANQKSCYRKALELGADIVVMLHPDYQYTPRLITALASVIASDLYDVALGSRILGGGALRGGMPLYKYVANRVLTLLQNRMLGQKLSEYHTGYRAFSRRILETLPLEENGDDFVFDNEMLTQAIHFGFEVAEVTCPTLYGPESSSISFLRSVRYGLGVLWTSARFRLQRLGLRRYPFLSSEGRRLAVPRPVGGLAEATAPIQEEAEEVVGSR